LQPWEEKIPTLALQISYNELKVWSFACRQGQGKTNTSIPFFFSDNILSVLSPIILNVYYKNVDSNSILFEARILLQQPHSWKRHHILFEASHPANK